MTLRVAVPSSVSSVEHLAKIIPAEFRVDCYQPDAKDSMLFGPQCRVEGCQGCRVLNVGLCNVHLQRAMTTMGKEKGVYRAKINSRVEADRLWLDAFVVDSERNGGPYPYNHPGFRFEGLHPQLADQLRFFLFIRRKLNNSWVRLHDFARIRKAALEVGDDAKSLFDNEPEECLAFLRDDAVLRPPSWMPDPPTGTASTIRSIKENIARLCYDVPRRERRLWRQIDFGVAPNPASENGPITFARYELAWFCDWAKRFAEIQLQTGKKWSSVKASVHMLSHIDRVLRSYPGKLPGITSFNRDVVEYIYEKINLDSKLSPNTRRNALYSLYSLTKLHRELDWDPYLPRGVLIRTAELPDLPPPMPLPIDPFILAQLLHPDNLTRMRPYVAHAIVIGRHHGLRISSLITLPFDPVFYTTGGANIKYYNVKLNRSATQPIMKQEVLDAISAQQEWVRKNFQNGSQYLFPSITRNLSGVKHMDSSTLSEWLHAAIEECGIVNRSGEVVDLSWGNFRDTFATELLDGGVEPHVVASMLDHKNTRTLEAYAQYSADTTRRLLEATPRFNQKGDQISSPYAEPESADVEYMRDSVRLASSTVADGYCTLPAREECPHLNACYSCPSEAYVTTPNFLPGHLKHLEETQMLIVASEQRGEHRKAQKNGVTARHVTRIIKGLLEWTDAHPEDVQGTDLEAFLLKNAAQLDKIRDSSSNPPKES